MLSRITASLAASVLACACPAQAAVAKTPAAAPGPIPLQAFARHVQLSQPRLSPNGKYLSVHVNNRNGTNHSLQIFRLADMHRISILRLPKYQLPLNAVWVSSKRIVIEKGKEQGSLDKPYNTGVIITSDIHGQHQDYLYGDKLYGRRATTRTPDEGWGWISGLPPHANNHFYMRTEPWEEGNNHSMLYDVDAETGSRNLIAEVDVPGLSFLITRKGKPTFAYGTNRQYDYVLYRKTGRKWREVPDTVTGYRMSPIQYAPDGNSFYAYWSPHGGPYQLALRNASGAKQRVLAATGFSSIEDIEWTAPPRQPFAAVTDTGKPQVHFINADLPAAKLYKAVSKAFPGQFVDFINYSENGKKLLFDVSSDRNPGTYYLIDTQTHKAVKLFRSASWIHPERMSKRRVFRFKASDGVTLQGVLTLPLHRRHTNMPMVLMPHGGPYQIRDTWFFDFEAQMLASRGYLVLQVDYRGSGGRGPEFVHSGYRKWGTRIQQDLIDGVKWTIAKGYADSKRICVYGGSFGGYSALMSVIRAPGMFQCAIGYDGIYDLQMMYDKGDIRQKELGRSYLSTVLGHDDKVLRANSPADQAGKIKVPVFLIHGKDDKRAPFAQATEMRAALTKAGNPPEWMAKSGEGHGFYDVKNNLERMHRILAFLKKYIGPGAPVVAQTANSAGVASPR